MELKEQDNKNRSAYNYELSEQEMSALIESKTQRAIAYREAMMLTPNWNHVLED